MIQGYEDTWDTRIREIQGYVGYEDTRIRGYRGYKDMWDRRIYRMIRGIQGYVA